MSMSKRIAAIVFIFVATSIAWFILGATIFTRTEAEGPSLKQRVGSIWGTAHTQRPPSVTFTVDSWLEDEKIIDGKVVKTKNKRTDTIELPLTKSDVKVAFDLQHRQKGLMWYSTYKVNFAGEYAFVNTSAKEELVSVHFPLPAEQAVYDDFQILLNGEKAQVRISPQRADADVRVAPGAELKCVTSYKSQGLDKWVYSFGSDVQEVHDFRLVMDTNFRDIDFPDNSLSPTEKHVTPAGWRLEWKYRQPALRLPDRHANAGEVAAGTTGREDQLLRAGLFVLLFFPDLHHHRAAQHRTAPNELLLPRRAFFPSTCCWLIWWTRSPFIWHSLSARPSPSSWW